MCIRDRYPDERLPTFIGCKPSTSLCGEIVSITCCLLICFGSGNWTKIPETVSSLLSSSILSKTVFSSTVSGYLITSDFKPTCVADFSLFLT